MIVIKRIDQLQVGDLVDLERDRFADPTGEHDEFQFEYYEVIEITHETADCIAVAFEGFDIVGFPPDHLVSVEEPHP